MVDELEPEVVLMDVTMPGMNGIEAISPDSQCSPKRENYPSDSPRIFGSPAQWVSRGRERLFTKGGCGRRIRTKALRVVSGDGSYISPKIDPVVVTNIIKEIRSAG